MCLKIFIQFCSDADDDMKSTIGWSEEAMSNNDEQQCNDSRMITSALVFSGTTRTHSGSEVVPRRISVRVLAIITQLFPWRRRRRRNHRNCPLSSPTAITTCFTLYNAHISCLLNLAPARKNCLRYKNNGGLNLSQESISTTILWLF